MLTELDHEPEKPAVGRNSHAPYSCSRPLRCRYDTPSERSEKMTRVVMTNERKGEISVYINAGKPLGCHYQRWKMEGNGIVL